MNLPNALTLLRIFFVPVLIVVLLTRSPNIDFLGFPMHFEFWGVLILLTAAATDWADGYFARRRREVTTLGILLDPIADKLLLSTVFLVLSILHRIPWKFTVMVFSRDISILAASAVLFAIAGLRDFRPSIFGKANTFSQISAVFFVLLFEARPLRWIWIARTVFLRATFFFTIISALHYLILVQRRLREHTHALPPARTPNA